ncbi:MAG: hypothetical protein KDD39_04665 [Bdellovibrionales bacterium]|nr:hypothetical protein [Bdellovibrionales bacterium]
MNQGTLILAGTDLGNHADIPARSLEALRTGQLLVFEGNRNARAFLKAAGVHRDFLCYSEHEERESLEAVESALRQGQVVVYMSDQGMPNVADPGRALLQLAYRLGSNIQIIPGPSSLTTALAACPFSTERFYFAGFLPRDSGARRKALGGLQKHPVAVVLDTPYRLRALLDDAVAVFGPKPALLALDISGPQEQFIFAPLPKIHAPEEKLNFVLVIALNPGKA